MAGTELVRGDGTAIGSALGEGTSIGTPSGILFPLLSDLGVVVVVERVELLVDTRLRRRRLRVVDVWVVLDSTCVLESVTRRRRRRGVSLLLESTCRCWVTCGLGSV